MVPCTITTIVDKAPFRTDKAGCSVPIEEQRFAVPTRVR